MGNKRRKQAAIAVVKAVVPVALIASGIAAALFFSATRQSAEPREETSPAPAVEVVSVEKRDVSPLISGMGTVRASRSITLQARVSGKVTSVAGDFQPGGRVKKGETLIRLDDSDYRIQLEKSRRSWQQEKADLQIEQGKQEVARKDLASFKESSQREVSSERLVLRQPQLLQARAAVGKAKADLKQARLDLERTTIEAPFNALVTERNVNLGSQVNTQQDLATLVCTDTYWIEAKIPLDRLEHLALEGGDQPRATVYSQARDAEWEGRALRTTGVLGEESSMATVIVAVEDPLGLERETGTSALAFKEYVRVAIRGEELADVAVIPRRAMRQQNRVWVASSEGRLDIRRVSTAWKSGNRVLVQSGLETGEKVIVSELATPVPGMRLRVSGTRGRSGNETEGSSGAEE